MSASKDSSAQGGAAVAIHDGKRQAVADFSGARRAAAPSVPPPGGAGERKVCECSLGSAQNRAHRLCRHPLLPFERVPNMQAQAAERMERLLAGRG